jgi:hypothetical protein
MRRFGVAESAHTLGEAEISGIFSSAAAGHGRTRMTTRQIVFLAAGTLAAAGAGEMSLGIANVSLCSVL